MRQFVTGPRRSAPAACVRRVPPPCPAPPVQSADIAIDSLPVTPEQTLPENNQEVAWPFASLADLHHLLDPSYPVAPRRYSAGMITNDLPITPSDLLSAFFASLELGAASGSDDLSV